MNLTIEKGCIKVDAFDLFESILYSLQGEPLADFLDSISCIEAVIENVAAQITDGWTELLSHGARGYGEAEPGSALNIARRRVAKASGEVAAREITELEATIQRHQKRILQLEHEAHNVREWIGADRYEKYIEVQP